MAYFGSVTITNKFGWSKTVEINKALLLVGRNKTNDIVLSEEQGAGVNPIHLQILSPKTGDSAYRIVNLAEKPLEIVDGPSAGTLLKPRSAQEIRNGDALVLGEFTLAFDLLAVRGIRIERRSLNLGMKLELPHVQLRNNKKLAGVLTLTNYGSTRRCQFTIEVEGLPNECFQVSPAPLLYPGASGELEIRFIHRGNRPPAGPRTITIYASASQAYPLEMIQLSLDLNVEPVHKYSLEFDVEKTMPDLVQIRSIPIPNPTAPEVTSEAIRAVDMTSLHVDTLSVPPVTSDDRNMLASSPAVYSETSPNQASISQPGTEPAPENAVFIPAQQISPEPVMEPVSFPEPPVENEQNWWASQSAPKAAQRQSDSLTGSRRNIRTMLAGKDIQVIKAGEEEIEDDSLESDTRQNSSAE